MTATEIDAALLMLRPSRGRVVFGHERIIFEPGGVVPVGDCLTVCAEDQGGLPVPGTASCAMNRAMLSGPEADARMAWLTRRMLEPARGGCVVVLREADMLP